MPTAKKKKNKNDSKYHFTIEQKVQMLDFDAKYCSNNKNLVSGRKMAKIIYQEFGWQVSHVTYNKWRQNRAHLMQSSSMNTAAVRIRDPELIAFEDSLDKEFDDLSRMCSMTYEIARVKAQEQD